MKRFIAAVGVLSLLSVGAANAATYDFETATIGTLGTSTGDAPFDGALAALGITSLTVPADAGAITPAGIRDVTPGTDVPAGFLDRSLVTGRNGVVSIVFGANVTAFSFEYAESQTDGFTAVAYTDNSFTTILQSQTIVGGGGNANGTVSFNGAIGSVRITDTGGDNVFLDNFSTTLTGVPEPSTYFMIGSALAGLAAFRRRRS